MMYCHGPSEGPGPLNRYLFLPSKDDLTSKVRPRPVSSNNVFVCVSILLKSITSGKT